MILVAFVLVLVATVMLIIGTFFDGGVAYIWISIAACVATFGVLAASYLARRRGADDEGARPQPLGAGESRAAAVRSGPRATTVSGGGTATKTREEPDTDVDQDEADEPTVTIVPSEDDHEPADQVVEEPVEDPEEAPAAQAASEPAPRRVAPRRVVRRTAAVGGEEHAEEAPPAWPSKVASTPQQASAEEASAEEAAAEEAADEAAAPTTRGETRQVVRRVQSSGTRKVVRRAPGSAGSGGSGGTRKVVRRAGAAQAGQRTVKRVVRRASASAEEAAPDTAQEKSGTSTQRSGTRGKKARAVLSEIKGVGPAKQDALLKRFGSLEDMAEASIDDLAAVKGVGERVATAIKDSLQAR